MPIIKTNKLCFWKVPLTKVGSMSCGNIDWTDNLQNAPNNI